MTEKSNTQQAQGSKQKSQGQMGHILLVDDDDFLIEVSTRTLKRSGYHVHTARDGLAAIDRCREFGSTLSCILLDMSMPRMDGATALPSIRELLPTTPVVLTSGHPPQKLSHLLDADLHLHAIRKPYRKDALIQLLDKIGA